MKKKIISALLCATILFGSLSMSSCYLFDASGYQGILNSPTTGSQNTTINVDGGDNVDVTINSSETSEMLAANKALLSAVSIYATGSGTGAGVIYKLDKEKGNAFIITNYHVVYNKSLQTANKISNDISVLLYGQEHIDYAIPATYVGGSMEYDLAVLKVTASTTLMKSNARAVDIANSDDIAILDGAIAIGNPEGGGISATLGHINVDSETLNMKGADNSTDISLRVIRTDAAVNHGNSGGGLFNMKGELIGIVNAKIVSSSVDGIGYAIPSNIAKNIAENIIYYCNGQERESVFKCKLGITIEAFELFTEYDTETGKIKKYEKSRVASLTYTDEKGKIVESPLKDKLKIADVLVSIKIDGNEQIINRQHQVIDALLNARIGSKITFKILRGGKEMTVEHTVTKDMIVQCK